MATVTWLGEDTKTKDGQEIAGPSFTVWKGIKFPKNQAVDVTDKAMLAKAKNNQFFKVDGLPGRPKLAETSPVDGNKNS